MAFKEIKPQKLRYFPKYLKKIILLRIITLLDFFILCLLSRDIFKMFLNIVIHIEYVASFKIDLLIINITFEYDHVYVNVYFIFQKSFEFNNLKINPYGFVNR